MVSGLFIPHPDPTVILFFTHPVSRIRGSKRPWIRIRNTDFLMLCCCGVSVLPPAVAGGGEGGGRGGTADGSLCRGHGRGGGGAGGQQHGSPRDGRGGKKLFYWISGQL
jgi:hypothetical protein